ncbi:hypothetical protein CK203_070491 [Vitis vinifera]|uniref:Uncharacterized protein n=1 Tax=Vitis vinifera TaxID=29760 RepID=A0A438FAR6_VITVI|nr:hypothetical protein CK203_070491 [Vitis vinifera]
MGGLGIRNLSILNRALLCKWSWHFAVERDSYWKLIISTKYGIERGGWSTRRAREGHGVGLWKEISKEAGSKDAWVADYWDPMGEEGGWTPHFLRPFNDWEVERLLSSIQGKRLDADGEDRMLWKGTKNEIFTVKSLYKSLAHSCAVSFPGNIIWSSYVPTKWVMHLLDTAKRAFSRLQENELMVDSSKDSQNAALWGVPNQFAFLALMPSYFFKTFDVPLKDSFPLHSPLQLPRRHGWMIFRREEGGMVMFFLRNFQDWEMDNVEGFLVLLEGERWAIVAILSLHVGRKSGGWGCMHHVIDIQTNTMRFQSLFRYLLEEVALVPTRLNKIAPQAQRDLYLLLSRFIFFYNFVDKLESFLKEFPIFPNSFLAGGPADIFVIELADQLQKLKVEPVLVHYLSQIKVLQGLELRMTTSTRLKACLYSFTSPGGPMYPTRIVRHAAWEALDFLSL